MKIYQISGLGANQKAFKNLKLNPDFEIIYIPWLIPEKNEELNHYAERMIQKINTNEDFVLMGLSFGGIMTNEINKLIKPKFNFLISTVKDRSELPLYMRFSSGTYAHKLIPTGFLTSDTSLSYGFFRKLYSKNLPQLKEVFEFRDHRYLKWAIDQIVNWDTNLELENYLHIHGDKDPIFPSSKIHHAEIIKDGTHVMVMNKPKIVSNLINAELEKL